MADLTTAIQRVLGGDVEAFAVLVTRFQDMAVGYAYALLGDHHLAEDATQSAFVTAFLNLDAIRDPAAFPGWMRRIVLTECHRLTRSGKLPTVPLEEEHLPDPGGSRAEARIESSERKALVHELVATLPERSREAIVLYYLADLSHREIAEFLGITEGAVKKRLHDARRRMQEGIEDMAKDELHRARPSRDDAFSESVMAVIVTAAQAIADGDANRLRALIQERPGITQVGGALDFRYGEGSYFAGATLLHLLAGNPTPQNPLPDNALELLELLLDADADPNATTLAGTTMLGLVAGSSVPRSKGLQTDMIDLLVSRGADPNHGFGRSALENALIHGETEAAEALHRHGARVDLRLASGLGRLDLMEGFFGEDGCPDPSACALLPPLGEGCKQDLTSVEVLSEALAFAVMNGQMEAAEALLGRGADVDAMPRVHGGGHTPLHLACSGVGQGDPAVVELLLEHGADPEIPDATGVGVTPLAWAVHGGRPEIVAILVERCRDSLDGLLRHAVRQAIDDPSASEDRAARCADPARG